MGGAMPHLRKGHELQVAVLTTSYPLAPGSTSGIFVARLLEAMPDDIALSIITPASCADTPRSPHEKLQVLPVRYAPKAWQRLAHEPGGLPVALRGAPWLRLFIPLLVAALALRTLREARTHHLIHANWAFNGCVAGIAGLLTNRPVLTSLRGEDVSRARKTWFAKQVLRLAIALSRNIVAVSTDMARWLRDEFPAATRKIAVVENGVQRSFYYRLQRAPQPRSSSAASAGLRRQSYSPQGAPCAASRPCPVHRIGVALAVGRRGPRTC